MTTQTITALMVAPGMHPCVIELHKNIDFLSRAVSIGINAACPTTLLKLTDTVGILYNNDAHSYAAPCNRMVGPKVIAGVFYVVSIRHNRLASLSPTDIETYKAKFWKPEDFTDDEAIDAWLACLEF